MGVQYYTHKQYVTLATSPVKQGFGHSCFGQTRADRNIMLHPMTRMSRKPQLTRTGTTLRVPETKVLRNGNHDSHSEGKRNAKQTCTPLKADRSRLMTHPSLCEDTQRKADRSCPMTCMSRKPQLTRTGTTLRVPEPKALRNGNQDSHSLVPETCKDNVYTTQSGEKPPDDTYKPSEDTQLQASRGCPMTRMSRKRYLK